MSNLSSILSFFLLISIFSFSCTKRPIIGIYGNPYPIEDYEKNNADVIVGAYVRWLESFGAEVVAIHQWYTTEELDTLLSKINGVLFQGGIEYLILMLHGKKMDYILLINQYLQDSPYGVHVWGLNLSVIL